jgi:hypothetical protein
MWVGRRPPNDCEAETSSSLALVLAKSGLLKALVLPGPEEPVPKTGVPGLSDFIATVDARERRGVAKP